MSTDIFAIARENAKRHEKKIPEDSEAQKKYAKILKDIQTIEGTDGYKMIVRYWEKKFAMALDEIGKINAIDNPGQTTRLQERIDMSSGFLYYLSKLEGKG